VYAAGDFTRSYSAKKASSVTRQIIFVRPGTFIIFDRVVATDPNFRKSFLLQTAKVPERTQTHWVVTNPGPSEDHGIPGPSGKLFIQILEPADNTVQLFHGADLYRYKAGGPAYPPQWLDNPAPECRMEVSPSVPATSDHFLHVLTATDGDAKTVPLAAYKFEEDDLVVTLGELTVRFALHFAAAR
jgi:hypothetical protein